MLSGAKDVEERRDNDGVVCDAPAPFWKARPAEENSERYIYLEPSNENWDAQGQRVLQKALATNADYYRRFGNVDLNHISLLGPRKKEEGGYGMSREEAKLHEVARPVEVVVEPAIFVKAKLHRGNSPFAAKANSLWDELDAGRVYYPSVGGVPLHIDDDGTIDKLIWSNVGLADAPYFVPVNRTVKAVSCVPMEVFAKSCMPIEIFCKALEAGAQINSQGLTGGGALRKESLYPNIVTQLPEDSAYHLMAHRYLRSLGKGVCKHTGADAFDGEEPLAAVVEHFQHCEGLAHEHARQAADRLMADYIEPRSRKDAA